MASLPFCSPFFACNSSTGFSQNGGYRSPLFRSSASWVLRYATSKRTNESLMKSKVQRRVGFAIASSTSNAGAAISSSISSKEECDALVDKLLSMIVHSDRGAAMNDEKKGEINAIVELLEKNGLDEPLKSPLVFGEWDVVYTSSPTAAGGRFRSSIGRSLLKTKEMVQTITAPDSVGNRVAFDALGIIPGVVRLSGKFEALDDKWVKVKFERPDLAIGSAKFAFAGNSQVQLSVSYLDERVRLGRGSRGSIFVFKRR